MNDLAPIVLFCYNRPWHVEQTLNALSLNHGADQSVLYIFCDGPKAEVTQEQIEKINEVRKVVRQKKWCKDVIIKESSSNKGLANSIIDGVSEVVEEYGKVIVLEDDMITSAAFLMYMNKALDFYKDMSTVFSISGYNYPSSKLEIPNDYPYDTYVSLRSSSWGWATWKEKWRVVDWDVSVFEQIVNNKYIKGAFARMGDDVFEMLSNQQSGKLDVWSIRFSLAHFVNHAITIYPKTSYVDNIGNDGSGQNCGITSSFNNRALCQVMNPVFLDILYEDSRIINAFYNVYCCQKRPLWQKAVNFIARKIGLHAPFVVKKKIYNQ